MKDFYDIYTISRHQDFQGHILQEAMQQTLTKRGTLIERKPVVFREEFGRDPQRQGMWSAFLHKIREPEFMGMADLLISIKAFIEPVYQAICDEQEFLKYWNSTRGLWE